MTIFKPCIDLHAGQVKQIVGGSLNLNDPSSLQTNFESTQPIEFYVKLYKTYDLKGTHLIKLGLNNDEIAKNGLKTWLNQIQIGGGINDLNCKEWIEFGAQKKLNLDRLRKLTETVGKNQLVIDLSCKRQDSSWVVAMNQWRDLTDTKVEEETLINLSEYCSEFLVHAADYEGLCQGIDGELVKCLGEWSPIPVTYAGGAKSLSDLDLVNSLSNGKVDLTFGSSLDIFGGRLVKFLDLVEWNQKHS